MSVADDTASVTSKVSTSSKKSSKSTISIKIQKPPLHPESNEPSKSPSTPPPPPPVPETVDLKMIYTMLYTMQQDITKLQSDVKYLKDKHATKISEQTSKCLELKEEVLKVPIKFAMRCLEYRSLKGEMELFKYCYINDDDKVKVPIKCPNLHIFKYWCDNKWNLDVEGEHIKDTLFINFRKVYLKVNRIQNYEGKFDTARFTENQKHITNRLRDPTYQKKFMTALKALLKEI